MGKRGSLTDLEIGSMDAPVPDMGTTPPRLRQVPPSTVANNPINPPTRLNDLSDLESMKTGQLQACVVVTRAAFAGIYPEHADTVGRCEFVIVAGSRRRAAAEKFGLATLDVVVQDTWAATRAVFRGASARENIDRRQFDPLEEAQVVEDLVAECGTAVAAAKILERSPGWVSQRRALLTLIDPLKDLLRAGELNVEDARALGKRPVEDQEAEWRERTSPTFTAVNAGEGDGAPRDQAAERPPRPRVGQPTLLRFRVGAPPEDIAAKMVETIPRDHLAVIVATLAARLAET